ncbi:RT0821/Lpp0805 family surface protein [Fodinicurvata halophila]|uniref:RT0821/Lpp0805 family surface protein n=1 Tax=Fodinicurvata halophila TaxID=1419723 RepID=A0ABV8UPB3_9PROT
MMYKKLLCALAMAAALVVAGCQQGQGPGTKQTVGGLGGAALGGLAGSQIAKDSSSSTRAFATGLGAVIGLIAGSEIGKSLDEADRQRAAQAQQQAAQAPMGEQITWNNPNSGNYGSYTPVRDGRTDDGRYCREFRETVTIDGQTETATGIACRQQDGTWRIQQ